MYYKWFLGWGHPLRFAGENVTRLGISKVQFSSSHGILVAEALAGARKEG